MIKEIRLIHINSPYLINVYGFGSYFRSDLANDCDLLLVVDDNCPDLGVLYIELYNSFTELGSKLSIIFDLTVLTEREHRAAPLNEHDRLVELSKKL